MSRIEREKRFHNELAEDSFASRRIVSRLAARLYDKELLWGPVWDELGGVSRKVALDYGCGTGQFSFQLWEKGMVVHGTDIAEKIISMAKCNVPANVAGSPQFHVMDAHELQFDDAFFDFVFGNGILHHLDLSRAYHEVARVLKPGGKAFFMEPLAQHPGLRLFRRLTPSARTEDETPLTFEDIDKARKYFGRVEHSEHHLFCVVSAPLNLISTAVAEVVMRKLQKLDRFLFRVIPSIRRYAWISLIKLRK